MKMVIDLEECSAQEFMSCGFKQDWATASDGETVITMTSGAGCGNKYLQIGVVSEKEKHFFRMDMSEFLANFIDTFKGHKKKGHTLITSESCECDKKSPFPCYVCDGGLAICEICGKAEIELREPCD